MVSVWKAGCYVLFMGSHWNHVRLCVYVFNHTCISFRKNLYIFVLIQIYSPYFLSAYLSDGQGRDLKIAIREAYFTVLLLQKLH